MDNGKLALSGPARSAIKSALRQHADGKTTAQAVAGTPDVSRLTAAQLLDACQRCGIDAAALAGIADAANRASPIKPDAEAVADAAADIVAEEAAPDTAGTADESPAIREAVREVLALPYDQMPDAIRALVVKANKPPVVREVIKEVVKTVTKEIRIPAPAAGLAAAVHDYSAVLATKREEASRVFDNRSNILQNRPVSLWSDPSAPAVDPDYEYNPPMLAAVVFATEQARPLNVWLYGHRGTGKSTFGEQFAARTGRGFVQINFRRDTEAAELIGGTGIASQADGGGTRHEDGALLRAIRRPGCVVLLDEPDMAKAGTNAFLQSLLAERRILVERTGEVVRVADGVVFIVAANTRGHGDETGVYVDRQLIDGALADRFAFMLPMDYLPKQKEIEIVKARTGCGEEVAEIIVNFMRLTRERSEKQGDIAAPMGMRRALAWGSALARANLPVGYAFQISVLNHFNTEEQEVVNVLYKGAINEAMLEAAIARNATGETAQPTAPAQDPDTGDII